MNQLRPLRWHDFPLIYRLIGHGVSFDTQWRVTVGEDGLHRRLLYLMSSRNAYALRRPQAGLALLSHTAGDVSAGLAYLAPVLDSEAARSLWFALLDGLTAQAGRQGIVTLRAEVNEDDPDSFETLRCCGFAITSRQTLWAGCGRHAKSNPRALRRAELAEIRAAAEAWNARLPGLIRQAQSLPGKPTEGYLLDERHSPAGFAAVYRGRSAALIDLYLPLEGADKAEQIVSDLLATVGKRSKQIVFRLRHDMEWLGNPLMREGFECASSQAVLIRHTLARIQHYSFKTAPATPGVIPTQSIMS